MKTNFLIIMMILGMTSACSLFQTNANLNSEDGCVPPLYDVAFPVITPQPESILKKPSPAPPQGDWEIQDVLPFPQDKYNYFGLRPGYNELWFKVPEYDKIYRYLIDNQQWKVYQAVGLTLSIPPYNLFMASNGTVWGAGIQFTDDAHSTEPFLSHFNEAMDRFEYVEDGTGFLQTPHVRLISNIAEDQSGLLWFFVQADKNILVSFDVKTGTSKQHYIFKVAGGNPNVVIGLDNSIWFQDIANDKIIRYYPTTKEIRSYKPYSDEMGLSELPAETRWPNYLFLDHSGRLWFENYAFLEITSDGLPEWYRVVEAPEFITTDRGFSNSQYIMGHQFSTYQSSNNWYWFTGVNGIVRLDFEKGSWCLITTEVSEVVEDDRHNIWIAVFGNLYKYSLDP